MGEDDQSTTTTTTTNGDPRTVSFDDDDNETYTTPTKDKPTSWKLSSNSEGLYGVVLAVLSQIFYPDPNSSLASASLFHRAKVLITDNLPRLKEGCRNTGLRVLQWARDGSPLRLLLVISVGTIVLLTLTGIMVFLLFVAAATINTVILSLLVSLAAAGGFLAMFFAFVAFIYVGALSVAVFVISSATISATIAVLVVTGWIGFFWSLWLAAKKSAGLAKHSVTVTGSALSAWQAHRHNRHSNHHDD